MGDGGLAAGGYRVSFGDDKNVLSLDLVIFSQLCEYTEIVKLGYKWANFTVCGFYGISKRCLKKYSVTGPSFLMMLKAVPHNSASKPEDVDSKQSKPRQVCGGNILIYMQICSGILSKTLYSKLALFQEQGSEMLSCLQR